MSEPIASIHPERTGDSLGAILLTAREGRGLAVEQAARDTRIRAQRLREIENDDFSHFPHPSYARLFLVDYAKYLGIPFQDIRRHLPDFGECGSEGYQYLQRIPGKLTAARMARRMAPRRRLLPAFVATGIAFACLLGGFSIWSFMRNIDRIGLGEIAQTGRAEFSRKQLVPQNIIVTPAVPVTDRPAPPPRVEEAVPVQPQASATGDFSDEDHAMLFVGGASERSVQ
jgi:transcriptional regulator with XRE-family HTH domain